MPAARPRPHVLRLDRRYRLPRDVDDVWAQISRLRSFPVWWRWLRDFEVDGDGLAVGTRLRATVAPPVLSRFRVEVRFDEVEPPHRIVATVSGDLAGQAELSLSDRDGDCDAHVRWEVELRPVWMRRAARVARPAVVWGHDQVVALTVRRFRAVLRGR